MLLFIEKFYLQYYKWTVWGEEMLSRNVQKIHVSLAEWQYVTAVRQNW